MMEPIPCIICYRLISNAGGLLHPRNDDKKEALTRFFHFLGRHLDNGSKIGGEVDHAKFPFEEVIHAGLLTCADCSRISESFCELYQQMKSIELLLNWKVRTLKNIMQCAQRVSTRVREFRCSVDKLDIGDTTADEIFEFKKDLVKKCDGRLKRSQPRLKLHKYKPDKGVAKSVTETCPYLLMDPESSHTPSSPLSQRDKKDTVENDNIISTQVGGDLNSPQLNNEIVPMNMDTVGVGVHDENKLAVNEPLVSSAEVQVKENWSHDLNGNPSGPKIKQEPEIEISDIKPVHIPISSIVNGGCQTIPKGLDDNLTTCNPGTVKPILDSSDRKYLGPPPPVIILPTVDNEQQKSGMYKNGICLNGFNSPNSKASISRKMKSPPATANHLSHNIIDFVEKSATTGHMQRKKKTCNFCQANFVHRSTLSTHKLICPKKYAANHPNHSVSEVFENLHTGTTERMPPVHHKKYSCKFCQANFAHRSTLITHKQSCLKLANDIIQSQRQNTKTNTNTNFVNEANKTRKPIYRCNTCLKVFTRKDSLKTHFRALHLQLREFACDYCDLKFKQKAHLDKHRRMVHANGSCERP